MKARCKVPQIVSLIHQGALRIVKRMSGELGIPALVVDSEEVRSVLQQPKRPARSQTQKRSVLQPEDSP